MKKPAFSPIGAMVKMAHPEALRLSKVLLLAAAGLAAGLNAHADLASPTPAQGIEMPQQGFRAPSTEAPAGKPNRRPDLSWMKAGVRNMKQEMMFLEQNKQAEGVVTLESGLQYKILKEGDGPKPKKSDIVDIYYQGSLVDGTQFANHLAETGPPQKFLVSETIPGWRQALTGMPTGSRWLLFVPGELGYGKAGVPPLVGPNATLIYDLELVGVKPPDAKPNNAKSSKPLSKPAEQGKPREGQPAAQ
jgi:FKBP-type peptidyl-prolyl cis-trans isomerase